MVAERSGTALAAPHDVVLDTAAIARLPRTELEPGHPGVTFVRVWEREGSYAGVMFVGAGEHVPMHTHRERAHHVWVAEGRCMVQGRALGAGSYWYIPPGEKHSLRGDADAGCTLFYLFIAEA